ncbi:MAG TPA: site-2 protease family protein [Bacillota bacterium]|nr:site-2 protease family protein [Bacillota bacterium]
MPFDLATMALRLPALLVALSFHEFAHAWAADRLGDPTPRRMGRLTLEPWAHLDPIGTLMILLYGFGWAKPVPTNPYFYRIGARRGLLWTSLAGPAANVLLGFVFAVLFVVDFFTGVFGGIPHLSRIIEVTFQLNVVLAVFNLLPIPPLDGSKVLAGILPGRQAEAIERLERVGPFLLLFVLLTGVADGIIRAASTAVTGFLLEAAVTLWRLLPL